MDVEQRLRFEHRYQEDILREKKTAMMSIFRKALTAASKVNLKQTEVEAGTNFRCHDATSRFTFHFTIFNSEGQNKTFTFYDFWGLEKIAEGANQVVQLIKQDDFGKVESFSTVY